MKSVGWMDGQKERDGGGDRECEGRKTKVKGK